jgi:NTE family protein
VIVGPVPVSDAVAASAAFPVLLPQLNRTYTFIRTDGTGHTETILMTDGGVYDNLGLSPLLPGRSRQHTSHVYDLDYIIAVDAGPGRTAPRAPNFLLGRLKRSFEIAHTRNQDGSRARVHELAAAGHMKGFVYAYLGMRDARLPVPIADLVERGEVAEYPTNFARMAPADLEAIANRGEQLTRALIEFYCPALGA